MDRLFEADAKDDGMASVEEAEDVAEVSETTALLQQERRHRRRSIALAV